MSATQAELAEQQTESFSAKVKGIYLDVEFHIDVDSVQLDSVSVPDGCGDDITCLLAPAVISEIKTQITIACRNSYHNAGQAYRCPV